MQSEHACLLVCMRLFVFAWRVWWDIWCDRRCNEHFEMKNESSGFKRILPAKLIKLSYNLSLSLFDLSLSFSLCLRHHALGLLTHLDTKITWPRTLSQLAHPMPRLILLVVVSRSTGYTPRLMETPHVTIIICYEPAL